MQRVINLLIHTYLQIVSQERSLNSIFNPINE